MKRSAVILACLFLLTPSANAGPPNFVQAFTPGNGTTCGTTSVTVNGTGATIGDYLIVGSATHSAATSGQTVSSITEGTDTCGANDCTETQGITADAAVGHCTFINTTTPSVVVNFINGVTTCNQNVYVVEVSPAKFDSTAGCGVATSAASTTVNSGTTGTLSTSSDFVFAIAALSVGRTASAGPTNSFTELTDPSNHVSFGAYLSTSANTAINTTWTVTVAGYAGIAFPAQSSPTATATPTATASATATATPTATSTATATATSTATATQTATPTATATAATVPCGGASMGKSHAGLHSCGASL